MNRLCFFVLVAQALSAQPPVPPDNDFVHQQFGDSCSLDPQWKPVTGDLNADGVEDVVMVARCTNPVIDQDEKDFKVIDPMNSFYGDRKSTRLNSSHQIISYAVFCLKKNKEI